MWKNTSVVQLLTHQKMEELVTMLNGNLTSEASHVLELLYLLQSLCKIPMHSLELGGISL